MKIANPIYDVVFKYLMEDSKVAKIFLSSLTSMNIVSLEFLPQELSGANKDTDRTIPISIYRLDFAAKVKQKDGREKLIIIEVQKARSLSESMRFRKYLGKQYMNSEQYYIHKEKGKETKIGLPILSIYLLGESLPFLEDHPVLYIKNKLVPRYAETALDIRQQPYLQSLYHEGIIVNISALKKRRRDELEILLSIFDQSNTSDNKNLHIMNVRVEDFPEKFRPIILRLQGAAKTDEVRNTMEVEDDFFNELKEYEERVQRAESQKEEAFRQKEEAFRQKEEAFRQKEKLILLMLQNGFSKQVIAKQVGISIAEIDAIANKK